MANFQKYLVGTVFDCFYPQLYGILSDHLVPERKSTEVYVRLITAQCGYLGPPSGTQTGLHLTVPHRSVEKRHES